MIIALLGLALAAPTPEAFLGVGVGLQNGSEVLQGGLGPELGLRLHLGDRVSVHADLAPLIYLTPALEADLGGLYTFSVGPWNPALGLELATLMGGPVTKFTDEDLELSRGPQVALRGMVRPLCFLVERWTVCGPAVAAGVGMSGGLSLGLDLMQIGLRAQP